jgi:hypothetical protein
VGGCDEHDARHIGGMIRVVEPDNLGAERVTHEHERPAFARSFEEKIELRRLLA